MVAFIIPMIDPTNTITKHRSEQRFVLFPPRYQTAKFRFHHSTLTQPKPDTRTTTARATDATKTTGVNKWWNNGNLMRASESVEKT
jgi:hypothetical protein